MVLRRSARLAKRPVSLDALPNSNNNHGSKKRSKATKVTKPVAKNSSKAPKESAPKTKTTAKTKRSSSKPITTLPRTRQDELSNNYDYILGIDEAGRGPLCGPVVVAAALVPATIEGVTDSKQTNDRERLYQDLITSPHIRYAVAVMDAAKIDEINILQATLLGMEWAAAGVLGTATCKICPVAHADEKGCYIVTGANDEEGKPVKVSAVDTFKAYALIDGNRLPPNMPCAAETIVKGDSREYAIAAASVLAKVTRDRLMEAHHEKHPLYEWNQNKGYPTPKHMAMVKKLGATPIHRRSFAPLKHMDLDENGKIVES